MPSTADGFVYPNSSDPVVPWEDIQSLAESVQTRRDADVAFTNWTPVYTAGPTTLGGGGVSEGFYQQVGKLVFAQFRTEIAAGFAFTGTTFELVLPVAAYLFGGAKIQSALGNWILRDDSVPAHYAGTIGLFSTSGLSVSFGGAWNGTIPGSRVSSSAGNPITWAAGDIIAGALQYRAA